MTDVFGCIFLLLTCVCHIQLHVDIPLVVVFGVVERLDVKKEFPGRVFQLFPWKKIVTNVKFQTSF